MEAADPLESLATGALLQDHGAAGHAFQPSASEVLKGCYRQRETFHDPFGPLCKRGYTATSSTATATPGDKGDKGKDKGKGKKGHSKTPANKPICFRYNSRGCKKKAKCHFEHVCTLCFGDHPATERHQKHAKDIRIQASFQCSQDRCCATD